jgi:soluble lytic murein transglycosylase-like protein
MTEYQIKARRLSWTLMVLSLAVLIALPFVARSADLCDQYRTTVVREARAVYGPDAPAPLFLAQARQESSCRADVTAWDNGRGLAQMMDGTTKQVSAMFPELGPAQPYNPRWAIRALLRYDGWIFRRIKGGDDCQKWGAALKGYNAGPGYVMQAQAKSPDPLTWFGVTEYVPTRQSATNFEYSRTYPRKILLQHQKHYADIGRVICSKGVA